MFQIGAAAQYGRIIKECRRSAIWLLLGVISAAAIVTAIALLRGGNPEEAQATAGKARTVIGWLLVIGPVSMFFLVLWFGGAFDWLIRWVMKPPVCECGSTEFRLLPGWEERFILDQDSLVIPPSECARCGRPKMI